MSLAGNKIIYEENLKESRTTTTKKNPNEQKKKPSKTNVITIWTAFPHISNGNTWS